MRIRLIRKGEQKEGVWAGGTTPQLAIGPEGADYAARRFDWRISTARVERDESDFTPLPGIRRILMVLEGSVYLTHDGVREIDLAPFEQDVFEGAQRTRSHGRCVDFNLMTAEGWTGSVTALLPIGRDTALRPGREVRVDTPLSGDVEAFYCLCDETDVLIDSEFWLEEMNRGDFLLIESPEPGAALAVSGRGKKPLGVHVRISRGA